MQEKDFVTYEYKTKTVKVREQSRMTDLYEAFGWEATKVTPEIADNVTVVFRRDRKQIHKTELVRLERQAEQTFATIERLNKSKTLGASVFAYVFGVVAALMLGGGLSMTLLDTAIPVFAGGIIIGIVGIALCAVTYPAYRKIVEKKTEKVLPAIDDSEDKLASLMEKGNDLLNTDLI